MTNSGSEDRGTSLVVGLSLPQTHPDAARLLQSAREDGYDYVTTVLPHSFQPRTDVTSLESRWWRTSVVGMVEQPQPQETFDARLWGPRLKAQMEWATHMSIPAVLLPRVPTLHADQYARAVSSVALTASAANGQVWIRTELTQDALAAFDMLHRQCDGASNVGMMLVMDNSTLLPGQVAGGGASAVVASPNQSTASAASLVASQMTFIHKAIGSQLKAICFPTNVFLTNKRGYPTLSKTHQVLFTEILRRIGRTIRILVEGPAVHLIEGSNGGATQCLPYLQYIRHMRQRPDVGANLLDAEEATLEEPYLDHLQRPLQPLADHLEFQTYETFEKDPVKYAQYRQAILLALRDGWSTVVGTGGASSKPTRVTILVVGAGRGPLVTAALQAIREVQTLNEFRTHAAQPLQAQIWAVEKNPSAVLYLESMARHDPLWKEAHVRVLNMDMRQLSGASLGGDQNGVVDIVVSELLGSFGDNELSPECLDGVYATGLLKETTVCIPQQYTAYLAPVSSMRLHSEARAQGYFPSSSSDGLDSAPMGTLKAMETTYVVRPHAACQTHVEKACWEFVHPRRSSGVLLDNERVVHLEFEPDVTHGAGCGSGYGKYDTAVAAIAQASDNATSGPITVHGFLGTFSATLYTSPRDDTNVIISTAPTSFSKGMFSWFPLYFPLKDPVRVPGGASLIVSLWRKMEMNGELSGRVWHEWCARVVDKNGDVTSVTPIHNPNGRSYHVAM